MKKFILGFVAVAALGAGGGYYYWISTPEYAFTQIQASFKEKNRAKFESHVDIKKVSDGIIDEAIQIAIPDPTKAKSGWAQVGTLFAAKMIDSMKPQFEKMIENEIDKIFDKQRAVASQSKNSILKNMTNLETQISYLDHTKKDCSDNVCYFSLKFNHNLTNKQLAFDARMEKVNGTWKLVELPSFLKNLPKS